VVGDIPHRSGRYSAAAAHLHPHHHHHDVRKHANTQSNILKPSSALLCLFLGEQIH